MSDKGARRSCRLERMDVTSECLKILVVQESIGDARLVRECLEDSSDLRLEAATARTLAGVREAAVDKRWNLVILDLDLPDSHGIATLQAVRRLLPAAAIVVVVDGHRDDAIQDAIGAGVCDAFPRHTLSATSLACTIRRVMDRMKGRLEMDEQHTKLFRVFDALPVLACVLSPDFSISFANRAFHELFGEIDGRRCYELFRDRSGPCPTCVPLRIRQTGEPQSSEWTSSSGRLYTMYDQPLAGANGEATILRIGIDVTEQNRMRLQTNDDEPYFRSLAENAPDVIYRYLVSPEPRFDYISPAVTEISGYTPEEHYADPGLCLKAVDPRDRYLLGKYGHEEFTSKRTRDMRWTHRDGHTVWVEDHQTPIYGESGTLEAVEGVVRDITAWKRIQQALAESEKRYRLLFEHAGISIGYYTQDGILLGCNRIAAVHMEDDPGLLVGKTVFDLFGREDGLVYLHRIADAARTQTLATYEEHTMLPSGCRWFLSTYSCVKDADGATVGVQIVSQDITDQKAAEVAVSAEKEHLFAVLDTLPAFVYLQAPDYTIPFANQQFIDLFGEPQGSLCFQVLLGKEAPCATCRTLEALKTGSPVTRDWETEAGKVFELHEQPFMMEGEPESVLVIGMDVTEQRQAEQERKTADEIVKALPIGILIYRYEEPDRLALVSCNAEAASFFDLEVTEGTEGTELASHWPAMTVGQIKTLLLAVARGEGICDKELDVDFSQGKRALRMRAFAIPGHRVVASLEDVTELHRTEMFLELARHSLDTAHACIFWILPGGQFIYVNDTACEQLGIAREELLNMAVWDLDPDYQRDERSIFWAELKQSGSLSAERVLRRADGSTFQVDMVAHALEFRGQEYEFAFAVDATQRKTIEALLNQSQKLESIGTLAIGVAHEINNPLTGIINYAQLISDRVENAKLKRFADGIREEGERVAGIVRNLLSFSRRETEHHSPARIIDIVDGSLSLCMALIRRDQIQLEIDIPNDLPAIRCRSQEIQQILINLLTNARDALNLRFPGWDERKRMAVRAREIEEEGRGWIRLSVEDHGQGIPSEIIDRIFDPFFTTKPRDQGTGLGLSISYGLVRDHKGRMSVHSVPNDTTRFDIDLPADVRPAEAARCR